MNDRIDQNNGGEKSGMYKSEIDKVIPSHAVSDAYQWPRHLFAEVIDHVKEIPGVIIPTWIIAEFVLIHNTTDALMSDVRNPDALDLLASFS